MGVTMNEEKIFMLCDRIGYSVLFLAFTFMAILEQDGWIFASIMALFVLVLRWNRYKEIKITPK